MINVIHAVHKPLPTWSASQCTWWSLNPMLWCITCIILFLFQFIIQILTHAWVKLSCYRVLLWVQHPWCRGKGLPQSSRLQRGHHSCLQLNTGPHHLQPAIQARVLALLPHIRATDIGRYRGHLQLEGKPHRGECLCWWHRRCSRSDLLLRHRR
jgi:hypothetical protein